MRARRWGQGVAISVAAALAYLPAFGAGFVFDDHTLIEESRLLRGPLWRIWLTTTTPDYWPLSSSLFWLEWRLWGANALGYHAVNVGLHATVSVLLWRVLKALQVPGAWFAGLLFAVHPVAVESVAWVSETKNTLSGALFLASILAWLRFSDTGRSRPYAAALALFALAMLAKASVVMLPVLLVGMAFVRRSRLLRSDWMAVGPFVALASVFGFINLWYQTRNAMAGGWAPTQGIAQRVGGAGWALMTYLRSAFIPAGLGFVHGPWPVMPDSPLFYLPAVGIAVALVAVLALRKRSRAASAIAWAAAYHTLMLLPVLGFIDIAYFAIGPVSNHLQYLALMGPVALVGAGIAAVARVERVAAALTIAVAALLGVATVSRSADFKDDVSLWTAAARRAPDSAVAHAQLSQLLGERGRKDEALDELLAAARVSGDPIARHRFMSAWFLSAGRPREAVEEARAVLQATSSPEARSDAAWVLTQAGLAAEAVPVFRSLARQAPNSPDYTYWLGAALARQGQLAEAADVLRDWCRDRPGNLQMEQALALTLVRLGLVDEARERAAKVAGVALDDPAAAARLAEWIAAGTGRRGPPRSR